jgi:hypothetical protein
MSDDPTDSNKTFWIKAVKSGIDPDKADEIVASVEESRKAREEPPETVDSIIEAWKLTSLKKVLAWLSAIGIAIGTAILTNLDKILQ